MEVQEDGIGVEEEFVHPVSLFLLYSKLLPIGPSPIAPLLLSFSDSFSTLFFFSMLKR